MTPDPRDPSDPYEPRTLRIDDPCNPRTDDLQRLIDGELKKLPTPRAPATLMPRVLAAVGPTLKPGPWYARPWLEWPRALQVVSAGALVALGVGLAMLAAFIQAAPRPGSPVGAVAARIRSVAEIAAQAAALVRVFSDVVVQPAAWALLILGVSLSLACAALWSALERGAMGGASQQ